MEESAKRKIGLFDKFLSVWVLLCMVAGVLLGRFAPAIPAFLGRFEYANVSIPIAVLIWVMIFPMMMKVDFKSVKNVGKNPKGLFVTWVVNWLIKPFTMFGIAYLFFFVIFKNLITPDLATDYLAGAILLGAAPCTAMVLVWGYLARGNDGHTLVMVAINSLSMLFLYGPLGGFLLGVGQLPVPWEALALSIAIYVALPLICGYLSRILLIKYKTF